MFMCMGNARSMNPRGESSLGPRFPDLVLWPACAVATAVLLAAQQCGGGSLVCGVAGGLVDGTGWNMWGHAGLCP